ncbi:MAG: PP2C family serine/threonine-protein phosphatase [Deltaproteobacteria bacterium]|nr:PP2C family serine/threonine-protein phosphatase [Deltaproteobacteria bacterium]
MNGQKKNHPGRHIEMTDLSGGFSILCSRIPFRRNQDVIHIQKDRSDAEDVIAVVDGWNDVERIPSDHPGREAASFVARRYPEVFLALKEQTPAHAAQDAAEHVDQEFLQRYPAHVASVGAFAFCSRKQTLIVSVGTIHVWIWNGTQWCKPEEIGDYFLPQPEYESGSRTFWGRGELKDDPFYALRVDTVVLSPQTPFFMATDGMDDVLALREINAMREEIRSSFPGFFETVTARVLSSQKQRDDITLLMRWKR